MLCKKIREEASELCQTLEAEEGPERVASEAADLLYHSLVLLNLQVWTPLHQNHTFMEAFFGNKLFRILMKASVLIHLCG